MRDWFYEILYGLAISRRAQWAIIWGAIFFIGINVLGSYMTANVEFVGPMKVFKESLFHRIGKKYDKAAVVALVSFWWLAYKFYKKDKDRFF